MIFVWNRAKAIAQKEIYHIIRDPFTLALSLGLPIFMVFIFGFAIKFNVKNIPLAVYDANYSQSSRELIDTFGSSQYFIIKQVASPQSVQQEIMGNRARAALIIPGDFEKELLANNKSNVQILLDGSDNSTVIPILGYLTQIQNLATQRMVNLHTPNIINLKTRFLFNSQLNSQWFVIPGLMVVVMAILTVLLTSVTVAREWENGSMELLLTTPIEPLEIIIGKLTPYAILGISAVAFIYIISKTVFGVPFRGNLLVFGIGCLIFLITYLAQGLLISVTTRSQQLAMQISIISGLLPAQLLSGFIFPIESMKDFFQYLTIILPARWFMNIARQSYLKGYTFIEMITPFVTLFILGIIMISLGAKYFKRTLEE